MNKVLTVVLAIVMPLLGLAQLPSDAILKKYTEQPNEGVTASTVSGASLRLLVEGYLSGVSEKGKAEILECLDKTKSISFVQVDKQHKQFATIEKESTKLLSNDQYARVIEQNSSEMAYKAVYLKSKDKVSEILCYFTDKDNAVLVSAKGEYTDVMLQKLLLSLMLN